MRTSLMQLQFVQQNLELREPMYSISNRWEQSSYDRIGIIPFVEIMGRKYYCFLIDNNRTLTDFSVTRDGLSLTEFLPYFQRKVKDIWNPSLDSIKSSRMVVNENFAEIIYEVRSNKPCIPLREWSDKFSKNGLNVTWLTSVQLSLIIKGQFEHSNFCSIEAALLSGLRSHAELL